MPALNWRLMSMGGVFGAETAIELRRMDVIKVTAGAVRRRRRRTKPGARRVDGNGSVAGISDCRWRH